MARMRFALRVAAAVAGFAAGGAHAGAQQAQSVTFHKHVEPILQKNCQGCHRPGQIAPMSLLTYSNARPSECGISRGRDPNLALDFIDVYAKTAAAL